MSTAPPKTLTNAAEMRFALISAGTFLMGSPPDEPQRSTDEAQHEVEITRPFYLGVHPVTQRQFREVTGHNPSHFSADGDGRDAVRELATTDDLPAECVSWDEAVAFCRRLSDLEPGRTYRLPTEAEWEYACRGGAAGYQVFHYGDTLSSTQANFDGEYPYLAEPGPCLGRTSAVGSYAPNAWGLYDLHGNVWEWCADWYGKGYYQVGPRRDPAGPATGTSRVCRGGSWDCFGQRCRSAWRNGTEPASRHEWLGFRVVLVSPEGPCASS